MAIFENFKNLGEAFKLFGKEKDEEIDERSSIEKLEDFNEEKDIFSSTQSQESKDVESIDDAGATESMRDILVEEEKDKSKNSEDSLDKKLKSIEKVIATFSEPPEVLPQKDMFAGGGDQNNINQKPLDMGNVQAKQVLNDYLKPSVNSDRVSLLYDNLRKLNLI
tara:strand:- start:53 stop:547 length:495 start_codon:yes stop_codon:yes gene_type:complete